MVRFLVLVVAMVLSQPAHAQSEQYPDRIESKRIALAKARVFAALGRCEIANARIFHELTQNLNKAVTQPINEHDARLSDSLAPSSNAQSDPKFEDVLAATKYAYDRCATINEWAVRQSAQFVPKLPRAVAIPGWADKIPPATPADNVNRNRKDFGIAILEEIAFAVEQRTQITEVAMEQIIAAVEIYEGQVEKPARKLSTEKKTSKPAKNSWRSLGPSGIANGEGYDGSRELVSGRVTSLALIENSLFVGSAFGGVWKSNLECRGWSSVSDAADSLAIGAIGKNGQGNRLIIGTGEGNIALRELVVRGDRTLSGQRGAGIAVYETSDGTLRMRATDMLKGAAAFEIIGIGRSDVVLASNRGLIQSDDSGESWREVPGNSLSRSVITTVASIGGSEEALLVGVYGEGLFRVTRWRSNKPIWNRLSNGLPLSNIGRLRVSASPDGKYVYLYVATADHYTRGLYFSQNHGDSWEAIEGLPDLLNGQGFYNMLLGVDPHNSERIYVGGSPKRNAAPSALYRAIRVDKRWQIAPVGSNLHVDFHAIAFNQDRDGHIYVANDGGVWRSEDWGESWVNCNAKLGITQIISLDVPADGSNVMIAGTQDNGTIVTQDSSQWNPQWNHVEDGDGGYVRIHPADSNVMLTAFRDYRIKRSLQGGRRDSFKPIYPILKSSLSAFIAPYELDVQRPDFVLLGTDQLHVTYDAGKNWQTLTQVILTEKTSDDYLKVISVIRKIADKLFVVGISDGKVWLISEDEGWSSRLVFDGAVVSSKKAYVADLSATADGRALMIAMTDVHRPVWRCELAGTQGCAPLATKHVGSVNSVYSIASCDQSEPRTFFGTDEGVFELHGGGDAMAIVGNGLPKTAVFKVICDSKRHRLLAGTFGRGVWELSL